MTPPPPPPPPPARPLTPGPFPGKLSLRLTPAADRRAPFVFTASGKLTLPSGIPTAVGCKGDVTVRAARGRATVFTRKAALSATCTYRVRASFSSRRRLGRQLRFTARFGGNALVLPSRSPARSGRLR